MPKDRLLRLDKQLIVRAIVCILSIMMLCISLTSAGPESTAIKSLKQWFAAESDKRGVLKNTDIPLSKTEAVKAAKLLLQDKISRLRKERLTEWQAKEIKIGNNVMRFEYRKFGPMSKDGRSLYISMHGGGGTTAKINDRQWANQKKLYKTPPGSLYLAPRAPTNDWDLWHKPHIDKFFQRIIEDAILFENVNPSRVYIMGYSAGGDGVYQLAPRMADRWAAAAMMAGHPNDASPLGLRNIGFTIWCGELDKAYKRNQVAAEWGKRLKDLRDKDPQGYRYELHIQKEMGHWMKLTDAAAIEWMDKFTRNPFPEKVVWKQDNVTHDRFYWLGVPKNSARNNAKVIAERNGQVFTILKAEKVAKLIIRLNDDLCDMDKPVKVIFNGKTIFEGKVSRTIKTIQQSLEQRFDPESIFSGEMQVTLSGELKD